MSNGKVAADHPLASQDTSVSLETTYVIPSTVNNRTHEPTRFIIKSTQQYPSSTLITNSKSNDMIQRKNLSFIDAVNSKYLDLSTGLFSSSPSSFFLSSSSSSSSYSSPLFSSSISTPDQHRHSHNHFSSSAHTTTTNNKNLLSTSPLSVNNHPRSPVGVDSTITTTSATAAITLKEAIDRNILDARSAYVVDTVEQRYVKTQDETKKNNNKISRTFSIRDIRKYLFCLLRSLP